MTYNREKYLEHKRKKGVERRAKGLAIDDPRHGTHNGYNNWGCRCDLCTEAQRVHQNQYNSKRLFGRN